MSRRSSRRMWHAVATLVPLPLIGVGYVVASGSPYATEVELTVSRPGAVYTATRIADASATPLNVPRAAEKLFIVGGKGPRADYYGASKTVTDAGKQLITASLAGGPDLPRLASATRQAKADRLNPTSSDVALKAPVVSHGDPFMNASYTSPFSADFQVDGFRPSAEEIAYQPSPEALAFRYHGESQAEFEERERRCLATAIYFEARGEPKRGQIAVGQVILNRVRSPIFPETICGVVYQGQMHKGCQFSFTCDGHTDNPKDDAQWSLAQDLANKIMSGEEWLPEVGYSTYYHANYVSPDWARSMNKIDKIGRHIFYKKRNEQPYVVEASDEPAAKDDGSDNAGYLMPTLSLASAVNAVTGSVSAVAGSSQPPTQAMSLGYAANE
jgi:spore germination cell wall hydrolase CwlJ-like protein